MTHAKPLIILTLSLMIAAGSPVGAAPKGEPSCPYAHLTAAQRDTLGAQALRAGSDDKYKMPDEPILHLMVALNDCATANGWSEDQKKAALEYSSAIAVSIKTLKNSGYSPAVAEKMDQFLTAHHYTLDTIGALTDAQAEVFTKAMKANHWVKNASDSETKRALTALGFIADVKGKADAFASAK